MLKGYVAAGRGEFGQLALATLDTNSQQAQAAAKGCLSSGGSLGELCYLWRQCKKPAIDPAAMPLPCIHHASCWAGNKTAVELAIGY